MLRKAISFILSLALLTGLTANLSATAQTVSFEKFKNDEINQYDATSYSDFIIADNQKIKLYPTFEDQNKALKSIKKKMPEFLASLAKQYQLKSLSDSNWEQYKNAVYAYETRDQDAKKLMTFFDIYENKKVNQEIKDVNSNTTMSKAEKDQQLCEMLPYSSNFSPDYSAQMTTVNSLQATAVTTHYPSFSKMFNYMNLWYSSINYDYAYYYYEDSANFASQILQAGGMGQAKYINAWQGWWGNMYTSSFSWHEPSYFVNYWKVAYSTKSHYNFSLHIFAGDFIAYDLSGDGSYDHIGFVAEADNYPSTYHGKYYYDYLVAQHTSSYCTWASSLTNKWDDIESSSNVYAIIRPSQTY